MRGAKRGDHVDAVVIYFHEADYNITQVGGIHGLVMRMQMRRRTTRRLGKSSAGNCILFIRSSTCGKIVARICTR